MNGNSRELVETNKNLSSAMEKFEIRYEQVE